MDDVGRAHVRAEQAFEIARATPIMMVASVCAACVLLVAMLHDEREISAIGWTFMVCAYSAYCYVLTIDARKRRRQTHVSTSAILNVIGRSCALGVLWGALPAGYFLTGEGDAELTIFCLTCLMMGAGAFFLSSIPGAALAFLAPTLAGSIFAILQIDGADPYSLIALFCVFTVALARMSQLYAGGLVSRLQDEIETARASGRDLATGLPNRDSFAQELGVAFQRLNRFGEKFAVATLSFEFTDAGSSSSTEDALVAALANHLVDLVDQTDFVGCIDEREFGIVLAGVDCAQDAAAVVERLVRSLALPTSAFGEECEIRWATGIALAPKDGFAVAGIMRSVSQALEISRADADQTICFFDDQDLLLVAERRVLEEDLRHAVAERQLHLEFQPILDMATRRIVSCEALVRWVHPKRGLLAPDVFIPIAESTGLIHEIGEWIVQDACRVLARLPSDMRMAVNISAAQLRGDSVLATLADALDGSGISNERIDIEVTESLLIARDDPALLVIAALADAGFAITLDDFGTGYASLNYLNRMPLKRVKIDRQFTSAMTTDPRQAAIVNAILQLSKSLGLAVTAEGVETAGQLDLLRAIGCDAAQGYLISRPLAEKDLLALVAGQRVAAVAA